MQPRKRRPASLPLELVPSPERVQALLGRFGLEPEIRERTDRPGSFRVWDGESRRFIQVGGAAAKRELELARQIIREQIARAEAANDLRAVRELEKLSGVRSARPRGVAEVPILELTGTRPK